MLKVTFQMGETNETFHISSLEDENFPRLRSKVLRLFTDPHARQPQSVLLEASGEMLLHIASVFGDTMPLSGNQNAKWTNDLALTILVNL